MKFELSQLFIFAVSYLLFLIGIGYISDRGMIPKRWIRHPFVYVSSLGVFVGSWAFYGITGLAYEYGYGFLAYYFGASILFLFSPLLLTPLLRITKANQLGSLADLIAFRYRSPWAGILVTIGMLIAALPLLSTQIQAVSNAVQILSLQELRIFNDQGPRDDLALVFCFMITLFALTFGTRHSTGPDYHQGLVAAIAFETIVKTSALLIIGFASVYMVFGGFSGLEQWLDNHPEQIARLQTSLKDGSPKTLTLIFLSSVIVMPHMFHMLFSENPSARSIKVATWGVPVLFFVMSLPVLPILWAGQALGSPLSPDYYSLGIGLSLESPLLVSLAFVGGLSAASGAIIVTTIALANMCLNHLILPFYQPGTEQNLYRWIVWNRRILIISIIFSAYIFFINTAHKESLTHLGMAAFIASMQFLPGIAATLFWSKANHKGFIAGLICGFSVWFIALLAPIFNRANSALFDTFSPNLINQYSELNLIVVSSIGVNVVVFVLVSILTKTSEDEKAAAEICSLDDLNRPIRQQMLLTSVDEFRTALAPFLGQKVANSEIDRAINILEFSTAERRPYALRQLRSQVEANLSGLMGPSAAHDIINRALPYQDKPDSTEDIHLIEKRLEAHQTSFTGLTAELNNLRRYHRSILQNLPIGVCAFGNDSETLSWNREMEQLTGISATVVVGSHLSDLPEPWGLLLKDFLQSGSLRMGKTEVPSPSGNIWISFHRADLDNTQDQLIVVENITGIQLLEEELIHSERLASIGRLAAGVAHEIGNPVTGIACLAQNLPYETSNEAVHQIGADIVNQTERISQIVHSLVSFAHSGAHHGDQETVEAVNLHHLTGEAFKLLNLDKEALPMNFINRCDTEHQVAGDTQQLLQVLINLLANARDASKAYGLIEVSSTRQEPGILLEITDEGQGIPKHIQEQIFEPFFTTKDPGKGTGLGLALAFSIIEKHQGHIGITSPLDLAGGTRFTIRLPEWFEQNDA